MREIGSSIRLFIAFAIAFSLMVVPNLGASPSVPSLRLAQATIAPNVPWIPAGPSTDALRYVIFSDEPSELTACQFNPPPIDFIDFPLPSSVCGGSYQITAPISTSGYSELEFHMGQNFWGCLFNFGNAACGTHIRQAFAHGLDKNIFITTELAGNAVPIDNPVAPSIAFNTPDPCAWDSLFPQTGPNCIVNGAGGTAYHLAAATTGSGCANTPTFSYTPGCGTADFCAAADHLIAAGLATDKNPTTCVLTGIAAAVTSHPINFFVRSDDTVRLHAGESYEQFVCALFTGTFSIGCGVSPSTTNIVVNNPGPITAFPGFTTSTTTVALTWFVYTAAFGAIISPNEMIFGYDSQFVSGIPSIISPSGPCSSRAIPTFTAGDYEYICSSGYDSSIEESASAPCTTVPGDPATGQTHVTVTFANCPGTTSPTSASAAYKAEDIFGQNAYTIPWWSGKNQFAYLTGWQGAVLNKAIGFIPPGNFFTMLNAWNPSPPVSGTVRQGFSQGTGSANPFIGNTPWDTSVIGSVWDSLGATNPDSPSSYLDWMTIKTDQIPASGLSYTPPAGTVAAFRYTLRNDIFWHTGQKATAWDFAFSDVALKATGVAGGLAPVIGIKVLSPTQIDLDVNAVGPFTKLFLGANPILPGRDWVNASVCTASAWDAAANNPNFVVANSAMTACIAQASAVTASGVILPNQGLSNIDQNKIQPTYDPVASGNLIGSGPWMCGSGPSIGGPGCSSTGKQATGAGDSWTLTRYGLGTINGGSLNTYFRSPGNLALWAYSQDKGVFSTDFLNFGAVSLCFGKAVGTVGCTVWQHGIGGSASGTIVGLSQVSIVQRFVGVNWVQPYDWISSPPQNIATFPPVLHEGPTTLNPCSIDPVNGYDC